MCLHAGGSISLPECSAWFRRPPWQARFGCMTDGAGPGPIPTSYYGRTVQSSPVPSVAAVASAGRPWYRHIPGFRSGKWPKALIAVVGYLVIAAWLVQLGTNPALGVLGLLSLCVVVLAFNVANLRTRLPVFRSPHRSVAALGWSSVAVALLVTEGLAAPETPSNQESNSTADVRTSSPKPEQQLPRFPTVSPTFTPSPTPSPSPSPTPTPSLAPSPVAQPPALTHIAFLNAPLTAAPGQTVNLYVKTGARVYCTIEVVYKSGASTAAGLVPKTSSASGAVSWTWKVGTRTTAGTWSITVSCGNNSASTTIRVT
jgi:hypothetical protein